MTTQATRETDRTMGAAAALDRLRKATERLSAHDDKRAALVAARDVAMERCKAAGVRGDLIAKAAGVSQARVSQIAGAPRRTPEPAPATVEPMTLCPVMPAGPVMSGKATRRHEGAYAARVSCWVSLDAGHGYLVTGTDFVLGGVSLADTLASIPPHVERVFVTGDWAGVPAAGGTRVGSLRAWGTAPVDGWEPAGHWTAATDPVFRWTETATGRRVEILSATGWFGDADAETCARAWADVSAVIADAFPGARLLSTPATTGRDLWHRTIGRGVEYPTLSAPVRDLISQTAGQGRTELRAGSGAMDGFTYMDGRFMYAALVHGLPVGEAEHITGTDPRMLNLEAMLNKRGRWRVTVTVPEGWAHVGLLGRQTAAGWDYPATPGTTWETWADAVELRLAFAQGWLVVLHEGLVWAREGKPLTAWRDVLVQAWTDAADPLVRGALRAIVLFGLGGFAARTPTVEGWADTEDEVPANVMSVWREGDRFRFIAPAPGTEWQETMAHPEWPATVWARARVALLDHALPGGGRGGALHLPARDVLGFRTDAIYLAGDAPDWPDDGRPGRFRVKGHLSGAMPRPTTPAELLALREASEGDA